MSTRVLMLPVLETAAIGEMLVGMSSREASASSMLTLEEVSTGQNRPSGFWDGVMRSLPEYDRGVQASEVGDKC